MIYLDNNATTQVLESAVAALLRYTRECYSNASATTAVLAGVDTPRRDAATILSRVLNAEDPECFVFTSGATESNNWVLSSILNANRDGCALLSAIEHPSVAEPAAALARTGAELVEVAVRSDGVLDLQSLAALLTPQTVLVSIMAANNEIGTIQPIEEVGAVIRRIAPAAIFHTDATQVIGKVAVDLQQAWSEVDLLSFSAHKFHGPKGVGGLYLRPGITLTPILFGGGQEHGLRSGTTNTPGLAGLAVAAAELVDLAAASRITSLRNSFEECLRSALPSVVVHGAAAPRLPNTSCFSLPGAVGEDLAQALAARGILVGTGSACSSGSLRPPKTLVAMGVDYDLARAAIRISLSAATSQEDMETVLKTLCTLA